MITRKYNLDNLIKPGKVLVIIGPRQVGKSTLLKNYLTSCKKKYKLVSGDNIKVDTILSSRNFDQIQAFVEGYDIIAIDEVQQIENVGVGLKIMVDNNPNLIIIVTGSSSLKISHDIGEPLTGRKRTITLYPFAQMELLAEHNRFELKEKMNDFLVYGNYPEVYLQKTKTDKHEMLRELADSYLLKDVFALETLKAPRQLVDLLKLLAFQIGSLVSLNELSNKLMIDVKTVSRYLEILEKSFVIKKLSGFSRNLRDEVTSKAKYYFWDTGIRNAVINQFNDIEYRNDVGCLFENFMIMERIKFNSYTRNYGDIYFWRNYSGHEIDLIEERNGIQEAYEFKYNSEKKVKWPKNWADAYPNSTYKVINTKNYLDYILEDT